MSLPVLFDRIPEPFVDRWDPERPWDLLGETLDAVLGELPTQRLDSPVSPEIHLVGEKIVLGKGVRIAPGVVLEGPVFIGADTEIRPGAYIRGGSWIGSGCVIGASTEIKHSILFDGARAPHLNYVGDSILGEGVNLGAGTILSNFRHDGGQIVLVGDDGPRETGRRKLGAVLGDDVATGCNCVLHPGCLVGRETQLYPGVQLRSGIYSHRRIVKLEQSLELVERR